MSPRRTPSPDTVIETIPTLLYCVWGSVFLGLCIILGSTVFLQQKAKAKGIRTPKNSRSGIHMSINRRQSNIKKE